VSFIIIDSLYKYIKVNGERAIPPMSKDARIFAYLYLEHDETGFKQFYEDPHTKAKWYIKKNKLGGDVGNGSIC